MRNTSLHPGFVARAVFALAVLAGASSAQAQSTPAGNPGLVSGARTSAASGAPAQPSKLAPPALPPATTTLPAPDPYTLGLIQQQIAATLRYPALAKLGGEQGSPLVRVEIARDGRILATRLTAASGSAAIDREAMGVFERIGTFTTAIPAGYAPGQDRFSLSFSILFRLFHESRRPAGVAADAAESQVQPILVPLAPAWRAGLAAAIAAAWQRPPLAPEQYQLSLHLLLEPDGRLRDASLHEGSGAPALDTSLLDAVRRAKLPPPGSPALFSPEIQLCLAVPDEACAERDSLRTVGADLVVTAYVPDGVPILARVSQWHPAYLERINRIIGTSIRYPPDAIQRREEGEVIVRIRMQRDGAISAVTLVKPALFESLNAEARNVFARIARLPPVSDDVYPDIDTFEFQLPINFSLK